MKRTYVDSGVLIAAARGVDAISARAMAILTDPDREFVSSIFVKLEVLQNRHASKTRQKLTSTKPFS